MSLQKILKPDFQRLFQHLILFRYDQTSSVQCSVDLLSNASTEHSQRVYVLSVTTSVGTILSDLSNNDNYS